MKKKLLSAVLSVGAVVGLASCSLGHTHEFSENWSSNENGHWHACECDSRLLDSFASHVDANNDGSCDVCSHEVAKQHEHTYATEWSKDASGHWYDTTCDHKGQSQFAAHTEGTDGKCTACGYVVTAPSNVATLKSIDVVSENVKSYYNIGETFSAEGLVVYETYSNTLTDETISVAADLSKYTVSVKDSAGNAVTGAFSAFGDYTVTVSQGEVSDSFEVRVGGKAYASVAAALEAAVANADKVKSGSAIVNTDFEYSILDYYFGENYFGYVSNDLTSDYDYEYHFEKLADGSVFGIQVSNYFDSDMWETTKSVSSYYEPTEDNMKGIDLKSFFSYNYDVYGVEDLIAALYEEATAETSQNYAESFSNYCDACGVHHGYKFNFGAYIGYYFYEVEVEFVIDAASESIKTVEIVAGQFYDESIVLNEETGVYSYAEGVTGPDSIKKLSISQNAGERNYQNEYPAEDFLYASFDLEDAEGNKISAETPIEVEVGESVVVNVVSATPETADPNVDSFKVTAYDKDGFESYSVFGSYDEGMIYVSAYKVGEYTIEISTKNVVKSFKLSVEYAPLESFAAGVFDSNYYDYAEVESVDVYPNAEVDFKAVVNSNANGAYTVALASAYENVTLEEGYDDNYIFKASAEGTYEIVLTSVADSTITATLTVNVVSAPGVEEILVGTYEYYSMMMGTVTFVFTPESEGATSGTVSISAVGGYADSEGVFNYSYEDGYLTCLPVNAASTLCNFSAGLNSSLQVVCLYNNFEQGVCTRVEENANVDSGYVGLWTNEYTDPRVGVDYYSEIYFNEDGNGYYELLNGMYFGTFTWVEGEDCVEFSNVETFDGSAAPEIEFVYDSIDGAYYFTAMSQLMYHSQAYTKLGGSSDSDSESSIEVSASYWGVPYVYTAEVEGIYTFSVDASEALMGYNFETSTEITVYLQAGASIEIVMITPINTGSEETVSLYISKPEGSAEASDYETAITQTWTLDTGWDDVYNISFEGNTIKVVNIYNGELYATAVYNFVYDGEGTISYSFASGDDDILYWMFGSSSATFNSTFTVLSVTYGADFTVAE